MISHHNQQRIYPRNARLVKHTINVIYHTTKIKDKWHDHLNRCNKHKPDHLLLNTKLQLTLSKSQLDPMPTWPNKPCLHRLSVLSFLYSILATEPFWLVPKPTRSEKAMAPHSSTLAWKIPWTEEPGRLQPMESLRVRHDWVTSLSCIGEGNNNPLQYSCLENPRNRRGWWASVYGVAQSQTRLKWLNSSSNSNNIFK